MPISPAGRRDYAGRHAQPGARSSAATQDRVDIVDAEIVAEHVAVLPEPTAGATDRGTTPLVTTGVALGRWVRWMRTHGTDASHGAGASPGQETSAGSGFRRRPEPAEATARTDAPTAPRRDHYPPTAPLPPRTAPPRATAHRTTAPPRTAPPRTAPHRTAPPRTAPPRTAPPTPAPPASAGGVPKPNADWRPYLRPGLLVLGALLLQLAFIGVYVGAWHAPVADGLPVAVVSSPPVEGFQAQVTEQTDEVDARTFTNRDEAFAALAEQDVYAVLVAGDVGQLELHLASARGGGAADSLTQVYGRVATVTGTSVEVFDDVPLPATDNRGITPFYLVVGWVIGGYLVSTLLSFIAGSAPEPQRGRIRILSLLLYAVVSGIMGSVLVGPVLGIWQQNLVALAMIGVLTVFGAAATSAALSALFGSIGTGLTILLLVVLGNASSSGLFAPEMLPAPFRDLHTWLLTGAATTASRSIVYFDGRGSAGAYLVLLLWCALGSILYLTAITPRGAWRTSLLAQARQRLGGSTTGSRPTAAGRTSASRH